MSATTISVGFRNCNLAVNLNIENAEDRVHREMVYAPVSATICYTTSFAPRGEIRGPARKKDGTLSAFAWVTEHWSYEDAPEWLKAVVDAERPEWAHR